MTIRELLVDTLDAVEREAPACAREVSRALGERRVAIQIGGEVVTVATHKGRVTLVPADEAPTIRVTSHSSTVVAVVEGRRPLLDVIEDGELVFVASVDDLLAVDAALRWLVAGAIRSAASPLRWHRYRSSVLRSAHASQPRMETT